MKRQLQLALLVFSIYSSSVTANEIVTEGTITEVSEQIGNLVHLTWLENRIGIDREHWGTVTGNKTDEEKEEERLNAMIKRGIPAEIARKMMADNRGRRFRGADFLTSSPEGELFQELKIAAGAQSGGGGGGGEEMHWDGHGNGLYLTMHRGQHKDFRFMIRQGSSPFQEFLVEDHHKMGLRIQFISPNRHLLFTQSTDGTIRVAHTSDQRIDAFRSSSYEEMVMTHADFAADLGNMLEQIGINRPYSNYDPRIIKTVARLLHRPDTETAALGEATIAKLSSKSYQAREAAQRQIEVNFIAWRDVIQETLADPKLSPEIRNRLKSIQISAGFEPSAAEVFVRQRKLLDDVDYLSAIREEMPESIRPSIQTRIAELKAP